MSSLPIVESLNATSTIFSLFAPTGLTGAGSGAGAGVVVPEPMPNPAKISGMSIVKFMKEKMFVKGAMKELLSVFCLGLTLLGFAPENGGDQGVGLTVDWTADASWPLVGRCRRWRGRRR